VLQDQVDQAVVGIEEHQLEQRILLQDRVDQAVVGIGEHQLEQRILLQDRVDQAVVGIEALDFVPKRLQLALSSLITDFYT
jgi:hypothetical protein